jgi:hypothetical protein
MLKHLNGHVSPPPDMIEAARQSLSPDDFESLMQETGGKAPTPEQLCRKADEARARA